MSKSTEASEIINICDWLASLLQKVVCFCSNANIVFHVGNLTRSKYKGTSHYSKFELRFVITV